MIRLNFTDGTITHDDLSRLRHVAVAKQTDLLKEDMLQVEFAGGFLLDVGWYPEFDAAGDFRINVIKNHDWDRPVESVRFFVFGPVKACRQAGPIFTRSA